MNGAAPNGGARRRSVLRRLQVVVLLALLAAAIGVLALAWYEAATSRLEAHFLSELGRDITLDRLAGQFAAVVLTVGSTAINEAEGLGVRLVEAGIKADPNTCRTELPNVFAAGAAVKPGENLLINGTFESPGQAFPTGWDKGGNNTGSTRVSVSADGFTYYAVGR